MLMVEYGTEKECKRKKSVEVCSEVTMSAPGHRRRLRVRGDYGGDAEGGAAMATPRR